MSCLRISVFKACMNKGITDLSYCHPYCSNSSFILSMHRLMFFMHSCLLTLSSSSYCWSSSMSLSLAALSELLLCVPLGSLLFSLSNFYSFSSSLFMLMCSGCVSNTMAELNFSFYTCFSYLILQLT